MLSSPIVFIKKTPDISCKISELFRIAIITQVGAVASVLSLLLNTVNL